MSTVSGWVLLPFASRNSTVTLAVDPTATCWLAGDMTRLVGGPEVVKKKVTVSDPLKSWPAQVPAVSALILMKESSPLEPKLRLMEIALPAEPIVS